MRESEACLYSDEQCWDGWGRFDGRENVPYCCRASNPEVLNPNNAKPQDCVVQQLRSFQTQKAF